MSEGSDEKKGRHMTYLYASTETMLCNLDYPGYIRSEYLHYYYFLKEI